MDTTATSQSRAASSRAAAPRFRWGFRSTTAAGAPAARIRRGLLSVVARRTAATRIGWGLVSTLTVITLASSALAQAPGRYTQQGDLISKYLFPNFRFRVESADVFQDKSIRINFIVTNEGNGEAYLVMDAGKIQLVSNSLERVTAVAKPEGQAMIDSNGRMVFGARDAVKLSVKFPAFQQDAKRVNFVCFTGCVGFADGFSIQNIALFAGR